MLQLSDPKFIKILEQLIRDIVQQEIKKASFNRNMAAKVVSADNGALTASIQLLSDGVTISGVKNRSNQNLSANDLVEVTFFNNSGSNFCITLKH